MNDKDIIKALECCKSKISRCKECSLIHRDGSCTTILVGKALDLINRQKAEIETLRVIQEDLMSKLSEAIKHIEFMKRAEELDKITKW